MEYGPKLSIQLEKILGMLLEEQEIKFFRYNQELALSYIAQALQNGKKGVVIADEVGMGKTRVAIYTMLANAICGQSSLIIVPPGLIHQWVREWNEVLDQVREVQGLREALSEIESPLVIQRIEDVFQGDEYPHCKPAKARIVIIPHTLNMYIRVNSHVEYIDLPQLIRAHDVSNYHLERQYYNWYYGDNSPKGKASKYLFKNIDIYNSEGEPSELDLIKDKLFHFRDKQDNNKYKKYASLFKRGEVGFYFYLKSFFKLIGEYSIVVIDEAHKSKSMEGQEEKVLGNIIEFAKNNVKNRAFVIGMTATPIELSPSEWTGIVKRVGEQADVEIINGFHHALRNIRRSPNEKLYKEAILARSVEFEGSLSSIVTRRVRRQQGAFQNLLEKAKLDDNKCFPHHCRRNVRITLNELQRENPLWIDIAFYYESINKSLMGITEKDKARAKQFEKAFARGNLNIDQLDSCMAALSGNLKSKQEERVLFWMEQLKESLKRVEAQGKIHPRVLKTIDLVEEILIDKDTGDFNDEKVLIFTTFNESARELNDLLNLKLTLRLIDQGKMIPLSDNYIEDLLEFLPKIPMDGFKGNLDGKNIDFKRLFNNYQRFYENHRKRIHAALDDKIFLDDSFIGEFFFRSNPKALLEIKDFFSMYLVDHLLKEVRFKVDGDSENATDSFDAESLRFLVLKRWKEIVSDYLSNEESLEDLEAGLGELKSTQNCNSELPKTQGEDTNERMLDYYIDRIKYDEFRDILKFALDGEEDLRQHTSKISRRIYGGTKMSSRRNVQNLFNDVDRLPKVLVAQSRVGREGLNLHKACRNLILFHQEWNPGVVEQQIGRIDRIGSCWEEKVLKWVDDGCIGVPPKINIFNIVFEGTYDEHQSLVLAERANNLRAQLYGGILSEENLDELTCEKFKTEIVELAPSFCPQRFFNKRKPKKESA